MIARNEIRDALSAENFVAVRRIEGGPAAEALEPEIERARERIAEDERWLKATEQRLDDARKAMRRECDLLLRGMDGR